MCKVKNEKDYKVKNIKDYIALFFIFAIAPSCSEMGAENDLRRTLGLDTTAMPTKVERFNPGAPQQSGFNPFRPIETTYDEYEDNYQQEASQEESASASASDPHALDNDRTFTGSSANNKPTLSREEQFKQATALVQKGDPSGANMMQKLADQGYIPAQYNLAVMYLTGQGIKKNQNQGVAYLRKAADNGHVKAASTIGAMYLQGKGVSRNPSQARRYLTKAAQKGDAQSMLYLSLMYNRGDGVAQDPVQSYQWLLSLPSSSQTPQLQTKLNEFKQKLSAADQAKAESAAKAFKSRYNIR